MDAIGSAMQRGVHLIGTEKLQGQCWEQFEEEASKKKVIVFGIGAGLGFYLERYKKHVRIDAIIDNDSKKQGYYLDQFLPEAFELEQARKVISNISVLENYSPDEVVILIASINYYNDIWKQLENRRITNCFAVLIMEANYRMKIQKKEREREELEKRKQFANKCCNKYPIKGNKIFFSTYGRYTDHGKYITEALLKLNMDLDIVWEVSDLDEEVPDGIRKIYNANWTKCIYEMETAKIWVLNLVVPSYIIKRQEQLYLQTKHWASITLKKFYLDTKAFENLPEKLDSWKRDGKLIDYIITGSEFDTESCRRGFGFQGEVLQYGSSRSDALFRERENRDKVYEYYHLKKDRKSVIYAPTYRFDKVRGKSIHESRNIGLDFGCLKKALEKRFGGEWYILMRLHPSVSTAFKDVERPDFVIDVSLYADSQELVSAADIMISDFSSIMFEAAFVKKPVFLFTTDLRDYLANEYDLLISYEELPFPIGESNAELDQEIVKFDLEQYHKNVESFLEKYGVHEDGHASERVAGFISRYLYQNNYIDVLQKE